MVFVSIASCFVGCLHAEQRGQLKNSKVLRSLKHECSLMLLSDSHFLVLTLTSSLWVMLETRIWGFFSFMECC